MLTEVVGGSAEGDGRVQIPRVDKGEWVHFFPRALVEQLHLVVPRRSSTHNERLSLVRSERSQVVRVLGLRLFLHLSILITE